MEKSFQSWKFSKSILLRNQGENEQGEGRKGEGGKVKTKTKTKNRVVVVHLKVIFMNANIFRFLFFVLLLCFFVCLFGFVCLFFSSPKESLLRDRFFNLVNSKISTFFPLIGGGDR